MKSCIAPMITLLQYQLNYVTPDQKKKKKKKGKKKKKKKNRWRIYKIYKAGESLYMLENGARSFHLATLAEFTLTKPQIKSQY